MAYAKVTYKLSPAGTTASGDNPTKEASTMYATPSLFNRRNLIAVFLLLFVMSAAYGFAANNTVAGSSAGDGSGLISGYTVTNVRYTLDADPRYLNEVEFTLDRVAEMVKISFPANSDHTTNPTVWFDCDESSVDVTCTITANTVYVHQINYLRVVAVNNVVVP
jgi:hypothetical protein